MPPQNPNPRAHLNTGGRAEMNAKPAHKPRPGPIEGPAESKPVERQQAQDKPPGGRKPGPTSDHRLPAATKLEPAEMEKLDRIARHVSRSDANRSAALRWLVQTFDESTL